MELMSSGSYKDADYVDEYLSADLHVWICGYAEARRGERKERF